MKNRKIIIGILVLFVILIGGASLLYKQLSGKYAPDQLSMQGAPSSDSASGEQETGNPASPQESPENSTESGSGISSENSSDSGSGPSSGKNEEESDEKRVISAPDFTIYDIDGNEIHLSDYLGKPVVVNFWASWCGPCKMELPDFQEKYLEYADDIQFLMVNMTDGSRETVEAASAFIEGEGYTFPVFYDTEASAAMTYGVYSIPVTYFIDADGNGIAQATGAIDGELLQKGIDLIH